MFWVKGPAVLTTTVSDGFVYIEKPTVGGLARPLTLRQQKTIGRTRQKRMATTERGMIPANDMPKGRSQIPVA